MDALGCRLLQETLGDNPISLQSGDSWLASGAHGGRGRRGLLSSLGQAEPSPATPTLRPGAQVILRAPAGLENRPSIPRVAWGLQNRTKHI